MPERAWEGQCESLPALSFSTKCTGPHGSFYTYSRPFYTEAPSSMDTAGLWRGTCAGGPDSDAWFRADRWRVHTMHRFGRGRSGPPTCIGGACGCIPSSTSFISTHDMSAGYDKNTPLVSQTPVLCTPLNTLSDARCNREEIKKRTNVPSGPQTLNGIRPDPGERNALATRTSVSVQSIDEAISPPQTPQPRHHNQTLCRKHRTTSLLTTNKQIAAIPPQPLHLSSNFI